MMKNKMPLDGLGLNHDSGSVLCNMLKSHVLGQPGGGDCWIHACGSSLGGQAACLFGCKVTSSTVFRSGKIVANNRHVASQKRIETNAAYPFDTILAHRLDFYGQIIPPCWLK